MKTEKFSQLALGTRFRYLDDPKKRVYVKIGVIPLAGCVAEWDENNIDTTWIGQHVFCLNNNGKDVELEIIG